MGDGRGYKGYRGFDDDNSDYEEDKKKGRKKDKKLDKKKRGGQKNGRNDSDGDESDLNEDQQQKLKQQLYEKITQHLDTDQKKGIIPIVQEMQSQNDGNYLVQQNKKFQFDLFSLPIATCKRLEQYVQECIANNNKKQREAQEKSNVMNEELNAITDQIQNQIDEKLRENQMMSEDINLRGQNG